MGKYTGYLKAMQRAEKKEALVAYAGGKCMDCGGIFPQCCYHFDHRSPEDKSFEISNRMTIPLPDLMMEVDKCDLVCANCHAIRTASSYLVRIKTHKKLISPETRAKMSAYQKQRIRKPMSAEQKRLIGHGVRKAAYLRKGGTV